MKSLPFTHFYEILCQFWQEFISFHLFFYFSTITHFCNCWTFGFDCIFESLNCIDFFFIWIFIRILLMLSSKTAHYCSFLFFSFFFLFPVFILISYPTQFHIRWHSMKLISGIMKIIWRQALIFLSLGKWLIKGKMTTTKALQELHPSLLFCHWIYSDYCTWKYSLLVRYFSGSC